MRNHLQSVRQARQRLTHARKRSLSPTPETMEESSGHLSDAVVCLSRLQTDLANDGLADTTESERLSLKVEIGLLRTDLAKVGALLKAAADFYTGYAEVLGLGPDLSGIEYGSARNFAAAQAPLAQSGNGRLIYHG